MINNQKITSEMFSNSYCIFIDELSVDKFKNKIKEYKNDAIKIIRGIFLGEPLCIVIPNSLDFRKIEKELFEIKENNSGFWGQYGIGYSGETWKEI
jgi:hypothetical protein